MYVMCRRIAQWNATFENEPSVPVMSLSVDSLFHSIDRRLIVEEMLFFGSRSFSLEPPQVASCRSRLPVFPSEFIHSGLNSADVGSQRWRSP